MSAVVASSKAKVNHHRQVQNPTIKLATALDDFEAILSDRQRLTFRSNFRKPVANDVLAFVSRIDAENKGRGRKCVAPRLCTFLERTVQFSGIVDSFVQSNPTVAALVWGGVKTALLTASNIASYFDKVTSMIMKVSRMTPVYQRFSDLYPGCVELQAALCDYYATIIRMCIKIVETSQRSGISQFLSPVLNPFEVEFKELLEDLTQAAKNVDIEISFASQKAVSDENKLAQAERNESSLHRRVISQFQADWKSDSDKWRVEKYSRQANKMRCKIRDNLCPLDHMKAWRQAKQQHLPGTAEWFATDRRFLQWYSALESSVLWCCGKLGAGKTVFVSHVIAWHMDNSKGPTDLIAYFFCRSDDARTLSARNIIGSICRQLLDTTIGRLPHDELVGLMEQTENCGTMDVVDLILDRLENTVCSIILDGLDECDPREILVAAKALASLSLSKTKKFRILCSGRPELEYSLFKALHPTYKLFLYGSSVDLDIEHYISETLDQYLEEERLIIGDPKLILDIVTALRSGANGMFLWARLLIDELCCYHSDNEIREALADLPRGLFDIYQRKIDWIQKQAGSSNAIKSLALCCVLRRALTADEMREALTLELEQKSLQTDNMINDMGTIISACRGLLQIDEQEDTVHFIHHSVKQFLTASSEQRSPIVQEAKMEANLGALCLTYLSFEDFERQLVRRQPTSFNVDPLAISKSISNSDRQKTAKIAQKLLRMKGIDTPKQVKTQVKMWQSVPGSPFARDDTVLTKRYYFISYARDHWIYHLGELCPFPSPNIWASFCKFVERQEQAEEVTNHFFALASNYDELDQFALENDHAALIRYNILEMNASLDRTRFSALLVRASAKEKRRLRLVLVEYLMPELFSQCSIEMDHSNFVQLVLDSDIEDEYTQPWLHKNGDSLIRSILAEAIQDNRADMIMRIFESQKCKMNSHQAWQLFKYGVEEGIVDLVRAVFRKHEFALDLDMFTYLTPLQVATIRKQTETAMLLMQLGASASTVTHRLRLSSLAAAAWNGDMYLMEALVASGAQINPLPGYMGLLTPLGAAARNNQVAVVEYLLKKNADPNVRSGGNVLTTALELACEGGSPEIVEKLLIAGAEIPEPLTSRNSRSKAENRPLRETVIVELYPDLQRAIYNNDLAKVEVLVASGAMRYIGSAEEYQSSEARTVHLKIIDMAVSLHRKEILRLILQNVSSWMPPDESRERAIRNSMMSTL